MEMSQFLQTFFIILLRCLYGVLTFETSPGLKKTPVKQYVIKMPTPATGAYRHLKHVLL